MATKIKGKDAINGKEKRGSPSSGPKNMEQKRGLSPSGGPRNIDPATRKKTSKSSTIACSPATDSVLSKKSVPNYLKPTVSSGIDVNKFGKKQTAEDKKLLLRRRSFDNHLSKSQLHSTTTLSSSQIQKIPLSSTSRERIIKPLPPSPKTTSSQRIVSETTVKTSRTGKIQPIVSNSNSKIRNTRPSSTIKREAKVTVTTSRSTSPSSTEDKHEQEKKEIIMEKFEEEIVKNETEVALNLEDTPVFDLISVDLPDPEPKIPEEVKSEEEHIIVETPQIGEAEEKSPNEVIAEQPEENIASEPQKKAEAEGKEGENAIESPSVHKEKVASVEDSGDDITTVIPTKLSFKQGKLLEEEGEGDGGLKKLQFKEREKDVEVVSKPQYNSVIEETASKLVGKRKSKVKALVGAFEVVISLEEGQSVNESGNKVEDHNDGGPLR
ncbi:hypothetical protein NE237_024902 [Protea cynaroides]|uniref:Calmodulin-binding domain-containing protein n=1 Tax=Protea cynaroides TaxID=273540 RepID=A0A9Q0H354_9MAGN|nr:hypothetical protein NE237_024902 [Protea cynaroides]